MSLDNFPRKTRLFSVLGTPFYLTPDAWQFLPKVVLVGVLVALMLNRASGWRSVLILGVVYGLLFVLTYLLHTLGHIISAREVDAPMQANVFTGNRQVNIYAPGDYPPSVHVGRAIGGPLMNLTLATFAFVLWAFIPGWGTLVFAGANLIVGAGALLPIDGLDGGVLWRGRA